jgi:excisionase family DNA binding protein
MPCPAWDPQMAARLKMHRDAVRRLLRDGKLPGHIVGVC